MTIEVLYTVLMIIAVACIIGVRVKREQRKQIRK